MGALDEVRCYLKIEDKDGNDVTYDSTRASYEWVSEHRTLYSYEKSYYLSGGMAMHLGLPKGKYKLTFYTPVEKQNGYVLPSRNAKEKQHEWVSNEYFLDTENRPKIIFVTPTANENGFYNGGWRITNTAPSFYKFTKPYIQY